jgi:hypothetical protein
VAGEGSDPKRQEFRVPIQLTPAEYSRLVIESILNAVSVGELLRAAYFESLEAGSGQGGDD